MMESGVVMVRGEVMETGEVMERCVCVYLGGGRVNVES